MCVVYVHVHVTVCVYSCVGACGGQRSVLSVFLSVCHSDLLSQGLSVDLGLMNSLAGQ